MRPQQLLLLCLVPWNLVAQNGLVGDRSALAFSRSITIPLNALQLHDAAFSAWTWTFGKEPGARMSMNDRKAGTLQASARMNFRSTMLTGREETMGTISYEVHIHVKAGECRVTVNDLVHTGNRSTTRGGIHLKQLMRSDADAHRAGGLGRTNIERVHAELRTLATERIGELLQAFEARLRSTIDQ